VRHAVPNRTLPDLGALAQEMQAAALGPDSEQRMLLVLHGSSRRLQDQVGAAVQVLVLVRVLTVQVLRHDQGCLCLTTFVSPFITVTIAISSLTRYNLYGGILIVKGKVLLGCWQQAAFGHVGP
jgi:hypothetical protein